MVFENTTVIHESAYWDNDNKICSVNGRAGGQAE